MTSIGTSAFFRCVNLSGSLILSNQLATINADSFGSCGFHGTLTIPNSVTNIEGGAFAGCESISSINIPSSVTSIGAGAFYRCVNVEQITVDAENPIYDSRGNCNAIIETATKTLLVPCKNTSIPNTVTCIGEGAFENFETLTSIEIPNSVTRIGENAFSSCYGLTSLIIPNSVTEIGNSAFSNCWNLESVVLSNSLTSISYGLFDFCNHLSSVVIPSSVISIGERAFICTGLSFIAIPDHVTSIGGSAFHGCNNLTSVIIPQSMSLIDDYAFAYCDHLHSKLFMGVAPPSINEYVFKQLSSDAVIQVPCGAISNYSSWIEFGLENIIEDCNTYSIESCVVGPSGNITLPQENSQMGEEIRFTVTPNPGMHLVLLTVCNANDPTQIIPVNLVGKATSTYSFTMPPFGVVVMATFENGASVGEINNGISVVVYPNPTNGMVKIEAEGIKSISVFNLIGQQILNGQAIDNEFEIDLSGHEAGVYLIRIETTNGITTKRVVLTK